MPAMIASIWSASARWAAGSPMYAPGQVVRAVEQVVAQQADQPHARDLLARVDLDRAPEVVLGTTGRRDQAGVEPLVGHVADQRAQPSVGARIVRCRTGPLPERRHE